MVACRGVHLFLAAGAAVVRRARVDSAADRGGGRCVFVVASGGLGVAAAGGLDCLIPTILVGGTASGLSGEFASFRIRARSRIVAHVLVARVTLIRIVSIIAIFVGTWAILGYQVIVARRVAATIELLLVTQLLLFRRVHNVVAARSRTMTAEANRPHTCILILVVGSTGSKAARRGAFSLVRRAIVDFLSLYQLTVATLAAGADETPVAVSRRARRENAVIYLAVILLIAVVC